MAQITARAEGIEAPSKDEFFDHMFAELPENLRAQRDTMRTSSLGQNPSEIVTPVTQQA